MGRPTPQDISRELARIAMTLESDDRPSLSALHGRLRRVVASVSRESRMRRIASELVRLAQEDVELSLWDMEEGRDVETAWKSARHVESDPSKLMIALKSLKGDVDNFIDELVRNPGSSRKEEDDDGVFTSAPKKGDIGKKEPAAPPKKGPPGPPPKR